MLNDLQILQLEGVELDFKDAGIAGASPLHIAAANGYLSVVEFLLEHHVSTDVEDDDLWQPIHEAACWGHLEVIGFTPKPSICLLVYVYTRLFGQSCISILPSEDRPLGPLKDLIVLYWFAGSKV